MRKFCALIGLLALAMPGRASAGDTFSYNQLNLALGIDVYTVGHGRNDKSYLGWGVRLDGSREIAPHFFGFGAVQGDYYFRVHGSSNEEGFEYDSNNIVRTGSRLGLATNWALGPRLDVIAGVSVDYLYRKLDHPDYADSTLRIRGGGPGLRLGLRGLAGDLFEWHLAANRSRVDADIDIAYGADDSGVSIGHRKLTLMDIGGGFRFQASDRFAVGVDLSRTHFAGDTEYRVQVGLRFQWEDRDGPPSR